MQENTPFFEKMWLKKKKVEQNRNNFDIHHIRFQMGHNLARMFLQNVPLETVQIHETHQTERTLVDETAMFQEVMLSSAMTTQVLLANHTHLQLKIIWDKKNLKIHV